MFRWNDVTPVDVNGEPQKMYRERFTADNVITVKSENKDLDHIAFKYLGSELDMYKIMDLNAVTLIEERGDMSRITKLDIPNV